MHQRPPPESFLDKSVRIANQGLGILSTMKGVWDAGKMIGGGLSTVAPMMALL